jgi:LasA protease
MAPGLVVRSDFGAVVVDMDGDGYAGTGWAITYMHLETRDRVAIGTQVKTGDPLGHPSCEGGFSNGTHVHIARTYNGRWVAADGPSRSS